MIRSVKIILLVLCFSLGLAVAWVLRRSGKFAWRDKVSCWCHTAALRITDVRFTVRGRPDVSRPLLVVSNHLSYLDIPLLGSVFPFRFVAKQDIASWPGISSCCRVTDAIFVDRKPEKIPESTLAIQQALDKGDIVCLFPEATTGTGIRTLPFKSGFFALAETPINGHELNVQPVAVTYTHIRGLPIDTSQWPDIAWYGDMELLPHLWKLLGLGRISAEVIFLPPTTAKQHGNRKTLARHCERAIADAIRASRGKKPD